MQGGYQHHWQIRQGAVGANAAGQGETIQPRHLHIGHQQVELSLLECVPGLQAVVGSGHPVPRRFENGLEQAA